MTRIALSILALGMAFGAFATDLTEAQRADIEQRIKPVGESCLVGRHQLWRLSSGRQQRTPLGRGSVQPACMACHATGRRVRRSMAMSRPGPSASPRAPTPCTAVASTVLPEPV